MLQKPTNFCSLDLINIKKDLNNLTEIYNFLDKLYLLNKSFKQIHKPVLVPYYYGKVENDCGVSCYSSFDGGYMTFHIFEKRHIAYFDIFSNSAFNANVFVDKVCKFCNTNQFVLNSNENSTCNANNSIFGPHLIVKGKTKQKIGLDNLLALQSNIIKTIGMTPITNPSIIQQKKYTTLFILIAESHIAITLCNNEIEIDIFSCKMFDVEKLKKKLLEEIDVEDIHLYHRYSKI